MAGRLYIQTKPPKDNQPETMTTTSFRQRGTMFDAAVFLANFLLAWPLAGLVRKTQGNDPVFAGLLLAAVVLHAGGAYFKRRPLHARLSAQNVPAMGGWGYILFLTLSVMHYAVFVMCVMVGLSGLGLEGRLGPAEPFLALGLALAPSIMAIAALVPPRFPEDSAPGLERQEALADGLIFFSTVIILAWWDGFWAEYLAAADRPNMAAGLLLAALTTVPFAMFYLAPRMVLLREDYARGQTWISAMIVMLPLAIRLIFGN